MPELSPPGVPPGRPLDLPGRGRTWVLDTGPKPGVATLVLLHGFTATAALNWFPCFAPLSRHFRVVALDQRGHGRGIRSRRAFRLSDCADDVVALADALELERVVPVGYSMGGPVAQLVWHRHPDRVDGLVLCATARNFRGSPEQPFAMALMPALAASFRVVPPAFRRALMRNVISRRLPEGPLGQWVGAEAGRNDPAAMVEAAQAIATFSSREWIGSVDVPTAVVVTLNDGLVPPARQLKLARAIPGAMVFPVEGDHTVCATRPDLFVPVLVQACRAVQRSAATAR